MFDISAQKERVKNCGVVPVIVIDDVEKAVPLTEALVAGGIDVIEVTMRTSAALEAIAAIKASGIDCCIGAGTITSQKDIDAAAAAGSEFLVTPATPPSLAQELKSFGGLVIPGVATPTEALTLYKEGFDHLKLFPAEAAGGQYMLKSIGSPLPMIKFMPTGGVTINSLPEYLKLPNVVAAGGTWLCSKSDLDTGNWASITEKAREAVAAVKSVRD